jgi:hypothetical protein
LNVRADGAFTIDNVYPWGRSFDEYRDMFALSDADLASRIIALADGPAGFNAGLTRRGGRVVSCDPLYRFDGSQIRSRVERTRSVMIDLVQRNAHRFEWTRFRSPRELACERMGAMETFLADYEAGTRGGRYVDQSLPRLAFADDSFDLAVCSHFLFLYSDEFSTEIHVDSVAEMARLARDVRIFPLLNMRGEPSSHVEPVVAALGERGLKTELLKVDYEFQRGGNEMLRVTRGG